MITLFHTPRSRSARFVWLLEELGAPYELKIVTIRRADGSGATDPANPHPHGKVPAIRDSDDGSVVFELPAIALYLTDKFPKNGIGPQVGDPQRGAYLTWLSYYTGVLEPAFMSKFLKSDVPRGTAGWVVVEEAMPHVIDALKAGPYLLGERFSAADVLYGPILGMFADGGLLQATPEIEAYVKRCHDRPAHIRAREIDGG